MKKYQQILLEAADVIRQGWTQHCSARNSRGQAISEWHLFAKYWCMGGALNKVGGNPKYSYGDLGTAFVALTKILPEPPAGKGAVASFNDTPGRKVHECIEKLEEAAA